MRGENQFRQREIQPILKGQFGLSKILKPIYATSSFFLFLLMCFGIARAQDLSMLFAKGLAGIADVTTNSIVKDRSGNLYVTGNFYGTADFDPGTER